MRSLIVHRAEVIQAVPAPATPWHSLFPKRKNKRPHLLCTQIVVINWGNQWPGGKQRTLTKPCARQERRKSTSGSMNTVSFPRGCISQISWIKLVFIGRDFLRISSFHPVTHHCQFATAGILLQSDSAIEVGEANIFQDGYSTNGPYQVHRSRWHKLCLPTHRQRHPKREHHNPTSPPPQPHQKHHRSLGSSSRKSTIPIPSSHSLRLRRQRPLQRSHRHLHLNNDQQPHRIPDRSPRHPTRHPSRRPRLLDRRLRSTATRSRRSQSRQQTHSFGHTAKSRSRALEPSCGNRRNRTYAHPKRTNTPKCL